MTVNVSFVVVFPTEASPRYNGPFTTWIRTVEELPIPLRMPCQFMAIQIFAKLEGGFTSIHVAVEGTYMLL